MGNLELIRKNIHMDCIRTEAVSQITLEDDRVIPDSKPDAEGISLEHAETVIDEIKPSNDAVQVRGKLCYRLLYHTSEPGCVLVPFEGEISIDEKIHLPGATSADTVAISAEVEDFSAGLINSRKLSLRSLVTLRAWVEEIRDEQVPVGLECNGVEGTEEMPVQYRQSPMQLAQIAVCRNDVFRIREEAELPNGFPNVLQLLWSSAELRDVAFRVTEGKIGIQGEVGVFVLYEGEGDDHPIRSYETALPISGSLECSGCREGMLPDIRYTVGQSSVTVRPDSDGEERCISLELTMDLRIRVYEEEQVQVLSDVYGTSAEITADMHKAELPGVLARITGKHKVSERVSVPGREPILHVLHSQAQAQPGRQTVTEGGLQLTGSISVQILYITENDGNPYVGTNVQVPYQYTLEVSDIREGDIARVSVRTEQLQVTMADGEELEIKVLLCAEAMILRNTPTELMDSVKLSGMSSQTLAALPGMVIYIVRPGDHLWDIGKKYYIPVERLRSLNGLEQDELQEGQKLLIAK